jgi:hypothetical protein
MAKKPRKASDVRSGRYDPVAEARDRSRRLAEDRYGISLPPHEMFDLDLEHYALVRKERLLNTVDHTAFVIRAAGGRKGVQEQLNWMAANGRLKGAQVAPYVYYEMMAVGEITPRFTVRDLRS